MRDKEHINQLLIVYNIKKKWCSKKLLWINFSLEKLAINLCENMSGIITITIMLYKLKSSLIGQFLVIGLLNKSSQDR